MQAALIPVIEIIQIALRLYYYAIIIMVILSWLINFGIVNTRNQFVYSIMHALNRVTEPALRRIRRFLPDLGGIDISPIILILVLVLIQMELGQLELALSR